MDTDNHMNSWEHNSPKSASRIAATVANICFSTSNTGRFISFGKNKKTIE
jgi:hypothetical protein